MKRPGHQARSLLFVLLGTLLLLTMLRWFEHNQVYYPARTMDASGAELNRPFEDIYFKARDGTVLNGWFYPAAFNSERKAVAFLVCHGNGGNISHRLELAQALLETGANVLLFDYRGYGRSEGNPSEEGTCQDAEAAHRWLQEKGFAPGNIMAFGESLGGGVASELARRAQVGGLILQSTFTSIPELGSELFPWLPVRWLARIRYDTLRKLPCLKVPVLVMHSRDDGLIGFHHAEQNFKAANQPKLFCEIDGTHNDPMRNRQKFIKGVESLLQALEKPAGSPK